MKNWFYQILPAKRNPLKLPIALLPVPYPRDWFQHYAWLPTRVKIGEMAFAPIWKWSWFRWLWFNQAEETWYYEIENYDIENEKLPFFGDK